MTSREHDKILSHFGIPSDFALRDDLRTYELPCKDDNVACYRLEARTHKAQNCTILV